MSPMPRPLWTPTDEQRDLLDRAARRFRRSDTERATADATEAEGWDLVTQALAAGVPKDRIAENVPRGRMTVYRHLPTKDQHGDDTSGVPSSA